MNPLAYFQWYRRWRGGVWVQHDAKLHLGTEWIRYKRRPVEFALSLDDEDWRDPPHQGCNIPPPGWYCSREAGHPGPCAARKKVKP